LGDIVVGRIRGSIFAGWLKVCLVLAHYTIKLKITAVQLPGQIDYRSSEGSHFLRNVCQRKYGQKKSSAFGN